MALGGCIVKKGEWRSPHDLLYLRIVRVRKGVYVEILVGMVIGDVVS